MPRPLLLAAFALLSGLSSLLAQEAPVLKPADHDKLAKAVEKYYLALDKDDDQTKAIADVQKVITDFEKRKPPVTVLSLVADWQRVIQIAQLPAGAGKKGINELEFESRDAKYRYAMSVPGDYAPKKGPYPLLLVIPDAGKKVKETIEQSWVLPELRAGILVAVCQMPADVKQWPEFGGGIATVMRVLSNLRRTYAVDSDRVFLCGMGAGVATAGRLAALFPHLFAGVIGRGGDIDALPAANFRALPTLWAGGAANCTAFAEQSETLGDKNCTVDPGANEAKIWEWLGKRRRNINPPQLRLWPISAQGGRCYWVEADRFDVDAKDKPQLEAVADRAANKITITGSGIEKVNLLLNDQLVDLSKPVEIVLNGETQKREFKRKLDTLLRGAYDTSDSGRVYTARESFVLPRQKSDTKKP